MANTQTKPYRVLGLGAHYQKVTETLGADGETRPAMTPVLAERGEIIDLVPFEADRLTALHAVKPADAPLSYEEMSDERLDAETVARDLNVGPNHSREDRINALTVHDHAAPQRKVNQREG